MFTGIIELLGKITDIRTEGSNRIFEVRAPFPDAIKVDQSIAHDGTCLTVTAIDSASSGQETQYSVTAVAETLSKTRLGSMKVGDKVNLERCLRVGDRLDGHFVQGHVDTVGRVEEVHDQDGSWAYVFSYDPAFDHLLVNKGSICVNGVSLTVVEAGKGKFSVAIIPYTYEHTNFHQLQPGDLVNLEFDILGKYMERIVESRR